MTNKEREAIGTVWHTTEKGKDIVSMHDAQYRALLAAIAERDEAIRVLADGVKWWRHYPSDPNEICGSWQAIKSNPIARAAIERENK